MKKREEVVRKLRGERPKRVPWKPIALVLVACVVVAGIIVWILWKRPAPQGDVYFSYRGVFYYHRSENNEPLENLTLRFPAPRIENKLAGQIFGHWELYYLEDDNSLTLQSTSAGVVNLRGQRNSQLVVYTSSIENKIEYGPTSRWEIDRFYPREVFVDAGWTWVPREKADMVTLRIFGIQEDWSFGYWHAPEAEQENKRIDFTFAVGLYRENALIERYEVTWEIEGWGAFYLTRTATMVSGH